MITPMKKVTILTLASHKEETLKALREMEIIHLTPLQNAVGASVNGAKGAVARVQKAMEVVPDKLRKGVTPAAKGASGVTLVEEIQTLISDKKNAEIQLEQAKEELEKLHAFGNLDPRTVKELAAKGIFVRLYLVDLSKEPFEVEGDNAYKHVFGKDENGTYIAVFTKGNAPASVKGAFTELAMPLKSLEEYRMIEEESNTTISAVDERFAQLASVKDDLEDRLLEVTDRYNLVEASASMLQNKGLAALQGFCPEPRVAEIRAAAKANGWGIRVEDPTDEDSVPTLLGYNKLSRPMQCLYDIIGISPGYNEVDVSSVFLCFFSIFFAMIVGDMAYGLLFLGIALYARAKMPKASSAGFHFVYLMSWATIIWGAINANFLGLTPELAGWSYYLDIANYNFIPEGVRNVLYWIRSSAPTDPTRFEDETWWDDKDALTTQILNDCNWIECEGLHYCDECWEYDDDDNIVTKDGRKWTDFDHKEIRQHRMNYLSLSEDMTLTQFRMELVEGKALFDSLVSTFYKSMLFDDLTEGKEWFDELLVSRKGTSEFDCYSTFASHGIFRLAQNDAQERMYRTSKQL